MSDLLPNSSPTGIGKKLKRNYPPSTGTSRSKEKINQMRETTIVSIEMLEGAKSIGAGAATIALAGAVVRIGNILCSLIHSMAGNPSLAKQSFGYAILGLALT
jgi:F-type H+-transporting ATPase subunit c